MVKFVDLMDARSICLHSNEQEMEKFWYSDQWVIEPTFQNRRIQTLINENGEISFWGKKLSYTKPNLEKKIPHIMKELKDLNLPKNSLIDGYFSFGNNLSLLTQFFQFNSVITTDKLQQDNGLIKYYLTDIIFKEDKDYSDYCLFDRKKILNSIYTKQLEYVKLQTSTYKNKLDLFKQHKGEYSIFIFKNIESSYEFRVSSNWKIFKEPEPYYMVITGFVDGKTENRRGMVVAFEGSQYKNGVLTKIMNIPVNNAEDMIYYYYNKQKFLGKVFEIKAFEKMKNKYAEARFHCMRNDLDEKVCIFDEEE